MRVDFNNLRRQALHRYDALVDKLNSTIITDSQWAKPNDVHHGQEINIQGYVLIDADDIQEEMDDLRMLIGAIACCSYENDDEFKDVFSEVYPNDGDCMKVFNDRDEFCEVVGRSEQLVCYTCNITKGTAPKGDNFCNMCDHYF